MSLDAALLQAAFESMRDGVLVVDRHNRVAFYNSRFAEMFGIDSTDAGHDAVAASLDRCLARPERSLLRSDPAAADAEGAPTIERLTDGRVIERHVAPFRSADPSGGRLAIYRDVTAQARQAEAAEERRLLLEKAQEVAHVGSWAAALDGSRRMTWSPEMYRIHAVPPEAFDGTVGTSMAFIHDDDREDAKKAGREAVNESRPYAHEHRVVRPDGTVRWVRSNAHVMHDEDGKPIWMIGTLEDVTERRQLEEQLRQAQKMEAIGRLAGGIAHDLNNALTAIAGFAELALSDLPADSRARTDVAEVRRAAERAGSVTRQLLAFSRRELLEPRVFSLDQTVENLGRFLGRLIGDDVQLVAEIGRDVPPVVGDPGQVEQAIVNLAVNARDAMPQGGRLTLSVLAEDVDEGSARAHQPMQAGRYVVLSVADTGHGMSPETSARIFEPFFTTKPLGKGTGLGLAMVYGTMKQSGGFIYVESEPGRGSTFRLYFPPAQPVEAEAPAATPASPPVAGVPTVLVVDDEPSVRALVLATLRNEGYRILQAASGDEALQTAREVGDAIDLLLTDATMPGMTGLELAQDLLTRRPDLPVIVMSGYTQDDLGLSNLRDVVSLCQKPFTPKELRERVRQALNRSPA